MFRLPATSFLYRIEYLYPLCTYVQYDMTVFQKLWLAAGSVCVLRHVMRQGVVAGARHDHQQ